MSPRPFAIHRLAAACALLPVLQTAHAQPAGTSATDGAPQQVTVSGSRTAVNPNTPAATDSIDRSRLADLNIANPEDSLKYLPNIATRKRYIGDRNGGVETRGTNNRTTARALVLADGVLLSNLLGSQDQIAPRWSMVFPEEVDRVDVIYGPFSALYSGNAAGAAILFTTRMPRGFEANAGLQLQRQRFKFLGTDQTLAGNLANAFVGDRQGAFSWQLGLSRLESTSQPTGFASFALSTTPAQASDRVVASGAYFVKNRLGQDTVIFGVGGSIEHTEQSDVKLKLAYDITPTLQARLTATRWANERDAGRDGEASYLRDAAGATVYAGNVSVNGRRYAIPAGTFAPRNGNDEHHNVALALKSSHAVGWNIDAVASYYDIAEQTARTATTAPPASFAGGAGTLNVQDGSGWRTFDVKLDRRPAAGESHWLTFGAHHSRYVFKQFNYATSDWRAGTVSATNSIARGTTETTAVYAQDAWSFAPDFKAILGLRAERWRTIDGNSVGGNPSPIVIPDRSENAVSPKAALEWTPAPDWLARVSVARATRFPTPMELFQGNISAQALVSSDPNLKPETGTYLDFTVERYFTRGSSRVTLYQERTRDNLFNQSNGATIPSASNATNVDRVRVRGLELAADTRGVLLPQLDLSASFAYNDAEILANRNVPASVGKVLPQIPRTRASFIGIWRFDENLNLSLAGRHSGKQFANLANDDVLRSAFNGVNSFNIVDARVNWRINRQLRLSAGVDNVADRIYSVNHPFPGRSFVAELKLGL
jgi:iron complex outermembrane receptor protein